MRIRLLSILIGLLLPSIALAVQTTVWDFREKQVPGSWKVSASLTPQTTDLGLHITAADNGGMQRAYDLGYVADVINLTFGPSVPSDAFLTWSQKNSTNGFSIPFAISGKNPPETITIPVHQYGEWHDIDTIGLMFPPGAQVLLQSISLSHWSLWEKMTEAWKTYWTFDTLEPYSINFLWGPMLTFTTPERLSLFQNQPPRSWSAVRIFYFILISVGIGCFLYWFFVAPSFAQPSPRLWPASKANDANQKLKTKNRWKPLNIFFAVFAALWLFFDLRMGLEFLSYGSTDYQAYIQPETGSKSFRTFGTFHDVVSQSLPFLQERERYAFLGPHEAFLSLLRYFTYPSLPVRPKEPLTGVNTWLIFGRPDVTVDAVGRLIVDQAVALTTGGKVLKEFGPGTFLYQNNP